MVIYIWLGGTNVFKRGEYSIKEENFIKDNYLKMSNKQLAKELNRNIQSIGNKLISLGLYRFDFNKKLSISTPDEGTIKIKNKFKVDKEQAKLIYKNWRKNYIKSRVI